MSVEYLIICDGCGTVLAGSQTNAAVARREVAMLGGLTAQPGGLDYCPKCRAEDEASNQEHSPASRLHDLTADDSENEPPDVRTDDDFEV